MTDVKAEKPVESVDVEMKDSSAPVAEASTSTDTKSEIKTEKPPVVFNEPLPQLEGKTPEQVQKLLDGAAKQSEWRSSF